MQKTFSEQITELRKRLKNSGISSIEIAKGAKFSARWIRKFLHAERSSPEIQCLDALKARLDEIDAGDK